MLETRSHTIPIPEPDLTPDEMLARAEAMRPILRERQKATEAAGHVLDETNDAFVKAGFYRAIQPRRFGGYEFGLHDFIRIMSAVARGCPSSGWVLALTAGHPHVLSRFSERAQVEVYGSDGDVRSPLRPIPGGAAEKCDGGYRVSGAWDYASGCDHATHFIGAAMVAGSDPPHIIFALFDRDDFAIVDNWDTIGMRGTGSKRVAVERAFIPAHRTITAPGTSDEVAPGWGTHQNTLYAGGSFNLLFFEIGAVGIGVARGALDFYEELLRGKRIDVPPFTTRGEQAEYQHHFGQATGLVDLAEAGLLEGADRYLAEARRTAEMRRPMDENSEANRRLLLLQQQAVRLAGDAVDLMFRTSGTSAAKTGSVIGNAMLALSVIRTHMGLQWDRTMENVARLRLGLPAGFL
jgi:3-hydroxy-9,10-secoandrosta-1,3,5(10)-triene-9,17-dione monooxygenase